MIFKIGDRIKFYRAGMGNYFNGRLGTIEGLCDSGILIVEYTDGGRVTRTGLHPKQCRRLRPRKKKVKKVFEAWGTINGMGRGVRLDKPSIVATGDIVVRLTGEYFVEE